MESYPDIFLDKYLFQADDVYLKIYLYLRRHLNKSEDGFSVIKTAEFFKVSGDKVIDALKYWEREKLICLEYDVYNRLTNISFPMTSLKDNEIDCTYSGCEERNLLNQNEVLQDLFLYAEKRYGRSLMPKEIEFMQIWIKIYGFSSELVIYLFELYEGKNIIYIHKIASEWFQHGIYTIVQAKRFIYNNNRTAKVILDAFGICDRDLADSELAYIEKWSVILKMSDNLIRIACQRTIQRINKVSFAYADSILVNWKQNHVKTEKDLNILDTRHSSVIEKTYKGTGVKNGRSDKKKNSFNLQQRDYDYMQLERMLLNQVKEFSNDGF